jgi:hypothetical protein
MNFVVFLKQDYYLQNSEEVNKNCSGNYRRILTSHEVLRGDMLIDKARDCGIMTQ